MIYGIGIDIVSIKRIKRATRKYGVKFLERIYTKSELDETRRFSDPTHYFAGRWAAKEAVSKALKTGIGSSCKWTDIEIYNESNGSPACRLFGRARSTAERLGIKNILITISHERKNICAFAVFETSDKI